MLKVNEMFCSIQGEGIYTGVPSFFVRTVGCNLKCVFKNSTCDTPYTSFNPEKPMYDDWDGLMEGFKALINDHPIVNHLVVTGGEPLLQKKDLEEFLSKANGKRL